MNLSLYYQVIQRIFKAFLNCEFDYLETMRKYYKHVNGVII